MFKIVPHEIDIEEVRSAVSDPAFGAILLFCGVTRNNFEGRRVVGLEYEAYPEMAVAVLQEMGAEAAHRWPGCKVAIVHRTGSVGLKEASVVIGCGTPHRDDCYQLNRYLIEQLKARVPVWKKEVYADGATWKANAES